MNLSSACVGSRSRRIALAAGVLASSAMACSTPPPTGTDAATLLGMDIPLDRPGYDVRPHSDSGDVATMPLDATDEGGADVVTDSGNPDVVGVAAPWVYVGTGDGNLTVYAFDRTSGNLTLMHRLAVGNYPSYGVFAPDGRHLYTTLEPSQRLEAFAIDATSGMLTQLGMVNATGATPTFISLDQTGRFALVADYGAGDVGVYPVLASGALGSALRGYSTGMLTHSVITDPSNHFALVCNKGSDVISQFRFDAASGALTPGTPASLTTAPGAGPRHIAFHPSAAFVYVVDETDCNVNAYRFNTATGALTLLQTLSTLAAGVSLTGNTGAELAFGPGGQFLYVSTRGVNTISVFSVDATTGHMTFVARQPSGGNTPRDFTIDGPGNQLLVANQDSNNVVTFAIEPATGRLTQRATTVVSGAAYWVGVLER